MNMHLRIIKRLRSMLRLCAQLIFVVFLGGVSHAVYALANQDTAFETLDTVPEGISTPEWQHIQSQIQGHQEAKKYHAYLNDDGSYQSLNLSHGWQIKYHRDGTTRLSPQGQLGSANSVALRLHDVSYLPTNIASHLSAKPGITSLPRQPQRISTEEERLNYHWNDNITEYWINSDAQLEQWFEIKHRPSKYSPNASLTVNMMLDTELPVSLNNNNLKIGSINYNKLKVWDAKGTVMPATMAYNDKQLSLVIDDSQAQYPLTIDPSFTQNAYIKASNTGAGDEFGEAIAISGDTLVIGASLEDSNATGVGGNESDNSLVSSGAVYVFTRSGTNWSQQAYLKASNTQGGDLFGRSVAIAGDTIIVGAPNEDSNTRGVNGVENNNLFQRSGAAYVFTRSGTTWSQQAYLKSSNSQADDRFGDSVAISGDTIVVGARSEASNATGVNGIQTNNSAERSGAAYVFTRSVTTWSQQAYLKASNTETTDEFGRTVAISGDTIVIASLSEDSNATGINGDQNNNSATTSGAVYVFIRSGTTWSQQAYLKASNAQSGDLFGRSVAIAGDTIIVGAPNEDSNATGINGVENNNSASFSGAVYVFTRSGITWSQQAYLKASNSETEDNFGRSVAIAGDTIIVGAPNESSNAIGVNGDQSDNSAGVSGAAYVFTRSGITWSQQSYLKSSNTEALDIFGQVVAIEGDTVIVSTNREDSNATGVNGDQSDNSAGLSGAAYVFDLEQGLIVLNNNDSGPDSLRDIVDNAAAGDTITFDPSLAGQTITLTSGDIDLTKDVTIDGSALSSQVAISGNSVSRVFQISNNRSVTLNALTLQDGSSGNGGLINGANGVTLDISDSTFQRGVATLSGGAILVLGAGANTVIRRSLFTQNTASIFGAAISNNTGNLSVMNTTVTNNMGASNIASIDFAGGVGSVTNSSVVNNTGNGINFRNASSAGDYHLSNTAISGNSLNGVRLISSATLTTNTNNSCDNCSQITTTIQQNALIAPLADNGGPTLTHALYSNSPALNAGNNAAATGLTTDQRGTGFNRVLAGTVDIGAFEGSVAVPVQVVNLSASTNTGTEAGTTAITLTATAAAAVTGDQTVSIAVSGTGISASDYTLSNTGITIANGQTTGMVTFTVQDDALVEGAETATLTISNPSAGLTLGATTSQNIVITDNDFEFTIGGTVVGLASGNSVVLQNNSGNNLTLNANGSFSFSTALADGAAYAVSVLSQPSTPNQVCTITNGSGNLTGANVTTVSVICVTDTHTVGGTVAGLLGSGLTLQNNGGNSLSVNANGGFTFSAGLNDSSAYAVTVSAQPTVPNQSCTVSNGTGTITGANISNVSVNCVTDIIPVNLSVSSNTGSEAAASVITLTATASSAVSGNQTVDVLVGGVATTDYSLSNTTITILDGQTTGSVSVTVQDDALVEGDETATISITNPSSGLSLGSTVSQNIVITDNDSATVTISDVSGNENGGAITVIATLNNAVQGGFSVDLSSADGSATTANSDYTAVTNATLTFAGTAGETQTINITPTADTTVEPNETVTLSQSNLSGTTAAVTITDTATVTINNDDSAAVTISDVSGSENAGAITVTATLNNAVQGGFSVDLSSADGSATTANSDYTAVTNTTLTFAGTAGETQTINITPTSDSIVEPNETVTISQSNLSGTTAAVTITDTATVTINNDDSAAVTISDVSGSENGGAITVTATLNNAVQGGFNVDLSSADGSATTANSDYTAVTNDTLAFTGTAGETQTINITPTSDSIVEPNETLTISQSNLSGTTVAITITDTAAVTINNDDSAAVTIADVSGNEDDGPITVTATLDNAVQGGFTVDLSTADDTATLADSDYTALSTTLTFTGTAGETQTTTVSPVVDTVGEVDETLIMNQANVQPNLSVANSDIAITDTATVTLINDDSWVVLNNTDSDPDSLRDIVSRAAAGDTIIFDPSLAGQTITLTSGDIDLSKDVTIDGSALSNQVAISGNSASRVFQISNNTRVTLNALTLQDGSAGSGGLIQGANGVTLDISDSTFQRGEATSGDGGAIRVFGSTANTIIRRSLFTQNTANIDASAISNNAGNLSVINTTLTNNTGAFSISAIYSRGGDVSVTNSSVVDNTGVGIFFVAVGDYHLSNTAISGNSLNGVRLVSQATLATNTNNLCDNCNTITATVQQDALIAPLADNGGPTLTHALYSNSPALNAGNNAAATGLTTDQRGTGFNRVLAGTVDIGAFEGSISVPVQAVNLSASANTGTEAGTTAITLTATAAAAVTGDQSISIAASGAGISASDYVLSNTSITIANGQTTGTVTFTVQDDALVEGAETATLTLSNPSVGLSLGSTVSQSIAITDNDSATVTISDVSGSENGGAITVTATLNNAVQGGFSVDLSTADGSATTANSDYTAVTNTTLSFTGTAGETQTINITPTSDSIVEANETLTISQSNLNGTTAAITITDTATVTINNDDSTTVTLSNASGNEDDGAIRVTATLSNAVQGGLSVALNTANGTATALDGDYTPLINSSLTFLGAVGETRLINIAPSTDTKVELNETLTLSQSIAVSVNNAAINISDTATVTIVNDDSAVVTINDASGNEDDGAITVTATLDNAVQGGFNVDLNSIDGTATVLSSDYTALSSANLAFTGTAGETQVFTVVPTADSIVEPNELFTVSQSNLSVANLAVSIVDTAAVTIVNDDTSSVTLSDISGNEDDGPITVTATLDNAVQGGFSVDVSSADDSATLVDNDYLALSATTLNFTGAANESHTFTVTPTADTTVEPDESVLISQSNLSLGSAFDAASLDTSDTAAVTISNDDTALITIETLSNALEGGQSGQFRISTSKLLSIDAEISFSVSGTATDGVDYASLGVSLTLPSQTAELIVDVIANIDGLIDENETVRISLSGVNNNSIVIGNPSSAEMLIIDGNDADSDGVENTVDNCPAIANADQLDFEGDGLGDVCDSDIDGDGLSNQYELDNGLNPFNSFDRDADPDSDGFTNIEEFNFGSDPQVADADENSNGIPDSIERRGVNIVPILQLLLLDD